MAAGALASPSESEIEVEEDWLYVEICFEFKIHVPEADRKAQAQQQLQAYPTKVPVVAEPVCKEMAKFPLMWPHSRKMLLPRSLSAGQMYWLLRRRLRLQPDELLMPLVGAAAAPTQPRATDAIGCLYDKFHDDDGFLYVALCSTPKPAGPKLLRVAQPRAPTPLSSSSQEDEGMAEAAGSAGATAGTTTARTSGDRDKSIAVDRSNAPAASAGPTTRGRSKPR